LQIDYGKLSNLDRFSVAALKKAGPFVPMRIRWQRKLCESSDPSLRHFIKAPERIHSHMLMAFNGHAHLTREELNGDRVGTDFMFAVRIPQLPWFVTKVPKPCALYAIGFAYRLSNDERSNRRDREQWTFVYVGIDLKTGEIFRTHHLSTKYVPVSRDGSGYSRKQWLPGHLPLEDRELIDAQAWNTTASAILMLFDTWGELARHWAVVVTKGNQRVTFHIAPDDAPRFFRQREASASDGKRKAIFHIVEAHERVGKNGRTHHVRTHTRGQREFDWNGYHCSITSPRFHTLPVGIFPLAPEIVPDDVPGVGAIEMNEQLNDYIDRGVKRRLDQVQEKHEYH
jgi:hypothetical protein